MGCRRPFSQGWPMLGPFICNFNYLDSYEKITQRKKICCAKYWNVLSMAHYLD